jgi:hypothetical protein
MDDDQADDGDVTGGGMRVGVVITVVVGVFSLEPEPELELSIVRVKLQVDERLSVKVE